LADATRWRVFETGDDRFPYRIAIVQGASETLVLRTQARWPGPGRQVFCLRETEPPETLPEPLEDVAVAQVRRFGRKLSLVLDRNRQKRCDFLFLKKSYKNQPGEYEQIFFRTQQSLRQHKSRGRTNLFGEHAVEVVIDANERYPWKFTNAEVRRSSLPVGDYALIHEDRPAAIVERKTFDNLLTDVGQLQILHQQLAELAGWPHAAVVVEAQYADFLKPERTGAWSVAHLGRVLAELTTLHPALPMIFAGNRKFANQWTQGFFEAVARKLAEPADGSVAEVAAGYAPGRYSGGDEQRVRYLVFQELPGSFTIAELHARMPEATRERLRTLLARLRDEGRLERTGHGRAARWRRLGWGTSE
jgi:hypothetical protein